jgi:hypothetical protein
MTKRNHDNGQQTYFFSLSFSTSNRSENIFDKAFLKEETSHETAIMVVD